MAINPYLKGILKKTPKGEDPKKGGVPYTPPGKTKMDGTPRAKKSKSSVEVAFKKGFEGK